MATTLIGDIHGNLPALTDVLRIVKDEVGRGDQVVFLGDYIDRGSDSRGCVDAILELRATTPATVVCLIGNHEEWLLKTRANYRAHSWLLSMDAWPTIRSYSTDAADRLAEAARTVRQQLYDGTVDLPYEALFEAMPGEHLAFFDSLAVSHRNDDCLAVHAGVDSRVPFSEQSRQTLVWGWDDSGFPERYAGEEWVVYGHRNNARVGEQGWPRPLVIGRTVGIDSSRYGVLTAYRLPDGAVFQSARHQ
jgi:serine/threonine protein phosphatase 1